MEILWKDPKIILPYSQNAKKHPKEQVKKIANSIKHFGWAQPLVVDSKNVLIIGHGRLEAAKFLKLDKVPVLQLENLSEDEVKALRLADNKLNESEWDMELVNLELGGISDELKELTGFEPMEVLEAQEDDFDITPPEEQKTKLGDLYQLGDHRLLCGDATKFEDVERLMAGEKADMVFTDPPYGVDYDGGHATEKRREKLVNDDALDMYDLPLKMASAFSASDAPMYLWFADRYAENVLFGLKGAGYSVRNWIIWNKNLAQFGAIGAQYKSKHEPCIYAFKMGSSSRWDGPNNEVTVWDVKRENKNEHHPTQKPIELIVRATRNHDVKSILDLFGGSGSTLIACEQLKRKCYMMELDPKYCDVIVNRWEKLTGKKAKLL